MKVNKPILVISDKKDDVYTRAVARVVFESLCYCVYGISDIKRLKENQRQVIQDLMYVTSLDTWEKEDKRGETIDRDDWSAIIGFGAKVTTFLNFGNHTSIQYRLNRKRLYTEEQGDLIDYWAFPSSFRIKNCYLVEDDPESVEDIKKVERAVGLCYNTLLGFESVSTMTKTVFVNDIVTLDTLVQYCKDTKEICFDFETFPKQKGLTSKKEILEHSIEFKKLLPSMLGISFQPGSGYILPMMHCESPWNIGCNDVLEILSKGGVGDDRMMSKNGELIRRYNDEVVVMCEENKDFFRAMYINWEYAKANGIESMLHEVLIPTINKVFDNPDIRKVAHNFQFDYTIGLEWGLSFRGRLDDTLIMHHTLREDIPHALKKIIPQMYPEFEGYGEGVDYANDPLASLGQYCATDNDLTLRGRYLLEYELMKDPKLYRIYRNYETSKLTLLGDMEYKGMPVNTEVMEEGLDKCKVLLEEINNTLVNLPIVKTFVRYEREAIEGGAIRELEEKISNFERKKLQELLIKKEKMQSENKVHLKTYTTICEKRKEVLAKNYYSEDYPYKDPVTWARKIHSIRSGQTVLFYEMNFNSPLQLGKLIYTSSSGLNYELPVVTRTIKDFSTGRNKKEVGPYPSTDKDILSLFPDPTGLIENILEFRLLSTVKSTYFEGIRGKLDENNRVHSRFKTVKSQRISSRNPNLHNIPSRTKLKRVKEIVGYVKRMFQTPVDFNQDDPYMFFQVDLSQAELRWLTFLWRIKTMAEAFRNNVDLHALASCSGTDISLEDYEIMMQDDPEAANYHRFKGKAKNFGLIYKMSAESFREYAKVNYGIDISKEQARAQHSDYLNNLHPDIPKAHELYIAKGRRYGWVRTAYGSKRHLPYINSSSREYRSSDERVSVNSPIQGSSGQGLLFSCIVHQDRMSILDYEGDILNTVHDSALGYIRRSQMDSYLGWMVRAFNNPPNKSYFGFEFDNVEMKSDIEVGENWKDLVEIEKFKREELLADLQDNGTGVLIGKKKSK